MCLGWSQANCGSLSLALPPDAPGLVPGQRRLTQFGSAARCTWVGPRPTAAHSVWLCRPMYLGWSQANGGSLSLALPPDVPGLDPGQRCLTQFGSAARCTWVGPRPTAAHSVWLCRPMHLGWSQANGASLSLALPPDVPGLVPGQLRLTQFGSAARCTWVGPRPTAAHSVWLCRPMHLGWSQANGASL